jgi:hypothetical protein
MSRLSDTVSNANDLEHIVLPAMNEAEALVSWRVYRLCESPQGIALIVGGVAALLLLWSRVFPHPFALIFALAALFFSLSDYLLPITYRLTPTGAHADVGLNRLYIAWTDVQRATHGTDGIFLSPFPHASRLDAFRGVRLRYGAEDAESLRQTVRRLRDAAQSRNANEESPSA